MLLKKIFCTKYILPLACFATLMQVATTHASTPGASAFESLTENPALTQGASNQFTLFAPSHPTLEELGASTRAIPAGTNTAVVDTESAGIQRSRYGNYLGPESNRLTQFSGKRVNPDGSTSCLNIYIDPEVPVSEQCLKASGLTNDFLADKGRFALHFDRIVAFLFPNGQTEITIIGHNIGCDICLLVNEMERVMRDRQIDTTYTFHAVDTLYRAKRDHRRLTQGVTITSPAKKQYRVRRLTPEERHAKRQADKAKRDKRRAAKEKREYKAMQKAAERARQRTTPEMRALRAIQISAASRSSSSSSQDLSNTETSPLSSQDSNTPEPSTPTKRTLSDHQDENIRPGIVAGNSSHASSGPRVKKRRLLTSVRQPVSFGLAPITEFHYRMSALEIASSQIQASGSDEETYFRNQGVPPHREGKLHDATMDVVVTDALHDYQGDTTRTITSLWALSKPGPSSPYTERRGRSASPTFDEQPLPFLFSLDSDIDSFDEGAEASSGEGSSTDALDITGQTPDSFASPGP